MNVRPATLGDYGTFARLFPELGVPDPLLSPDEFAGRMRASTLIAENAGEALGYTFSRRYGATVHVVHVVTDPRARGRGVGRALLDAVRARAMAEGCTAWFLNVKQENATAIRLYKRAGMAIQREAWAVDVTWANLAALPRDCLDGGVVSFVPAPEDDAELESRLGVDIDRLALLRSQPAASVLLALREAGAPVAFAAFDPAFPGVSQLRVARPGVARAVFDALRAVARHEHVHVLVDGDRALYDALGAAGARLVHAIYRMGARL
jgi:GNAT superfamily N-acetyltransferase